MAQGLGRGGGYPPPPGPPLQTKETTVGKNEIYNRENLIRPFLAHKIRVPDPQAPPAPARPCYHVSARPQTVKFMKKPHVWLFAYRIVAVLAFVTSIVMLWAVAVKSQFPPWIGVLFMPCIAIGDLWALQPLFHRSDRQCSGFFLKYRDKLKAGLHALGWTIVVVKTGLIGLVLLSYLVLGIGAALTAGFQVFGSHRCLFPLATGEGMLHCKYSFCMNFWPFFYAMWLL